jgi:hypothetical protein
MERNVSIPVALFFNPPFFFRKLDKVSMVPASWMRVASGGLSLNVKKNCEEILWQNER